MTRRVIVSWRFRRSIALAVVAIVAAGAGAVTRSTQAHAGEFAGCRWIEVLCQERGLLNWDHFVMSNDIWLYVPFVDMSNHSGGWLPATAMAVGDHRPVDQVPWCGNVHVP